MDENLIRSYAEKRVKMKQGFYYHLIAFIVVNIFLVVVRIFSFGINWTLIFPAAPWLIGLIFHWFSAFKSNDPVTFERKVQKEIDQYYQSK